MLVMQAHPNSPTVAHPDSPHQRPSWSAFAGALLLGFALVTGTAGIARAAGDESAIPGGETEGKAYVNQYFLTAAMVGMGLFLLCRPARRKREAKVERELATASKDGANV